MLCQRLSGHGAGRVGRDRDEPLCQRQQQRQHLVHILVGHDAEQEDELLPREAVPEALDGGPHPVGVVTAVQQESGRMPQQLEPARPAHPLEAGADGAVGDVPSPAPQHTEGRDGEGGVFRLIAADEGQTNAVQPVEIEGDSVEVAALHFEAGEIHHRERRVLLLGHTGDDSVRFRHTAVAHHRTARLDDAGLGGGDVRDGGAEFFYMVHAQRRDDRALGRVDDVG